MATVMGTKNNEALDIQVYPRGAIGYHYTPVVENGILKWTNDGGLENPANYRVKGDAATISVGTSTISTNDDFTVTNSGTTGDAVFDFEYPEPGTRTKLNGKNTYDRDISIYAPTVSGNNGQILQSKGANQSSQWIDDKMAPYTTITENGNIEDIITTSGWYYLPQGKTLNISCYYIDDTTTQETLNISGPSYLYVKITNSNISTINSESLENGFIARVSNKLIFFPYYQDISSFQTANDVSTLISNKLTTDKYITETSYATATKGGAIKIKLDGDVLYISTDGSDL